MVPAGGDGGIPPTADDIERIRRQAASAVRRTCPAWLRERADDIVQDVVLQVLTLTRKSEGNRQFSAMYVEKAVYGTTMQEIRRLYRRREAAVDNPAILDRNPSTGADPERGARSGEIAAGVDECLRKLLRPRRLAVILYLQGCSVPSAALHLRWTVKRTENLVYRGLADLRRCLAAKGLTP